MERKFQRFISCLFMILVVVFLFGCKQPTDSETGAPTQPGTGAPTQPGTGALPSPTNLSVTAAEDAENFVTLTWSTGTDVAEYYWIYYSTTNDTTALKSPQKKVSLFLWDEGTGTCDIGLDKSGTYYFWVKAANGYGDNSSTSSFCGPASYQFTFKALTVPTNLEVKAHESKLNTVTLTWSTGTDVAEYYWIYYSSTNDTTALTRPQTKQSSYSSWKDTGTGTCDIVLDKSGTYYFWVKAANGYGEDSPSSAFSTVASHQFTYQPLSVPENLNAEKYGEGTSFPGIKLSWNPTNAPYYHIYWSESNDSSTAKKLTTTSLTYDTIYESVYELKKGTTYYFWVKSANGYSPADSDSGFSKSISFTYN